MSTLEMVRPRILCRPASFIDVGIGKDAVQLAEYAGLKLFDWEAYILEQSLGIRDDNKWASFEIGLIVSRQNGKGSILEARELAGLFLLGEKLIIHSAHQFDTSIEAFMRVSQLIKNTPDLDAQVARMPNSHGSEGVELKNGQRLKFRTRTKGGGRGFTADCLILDEGMYLGSAMVSALMPTLSARPNSQIWVTASAGDKESTQLGSIRRRALKGDDPSLLFAEYSIEGCTDFCDPELRDFKCPDHLPVNSPKSWRLANPSMGITISEEAVAREFRAMDLNSFKQERLGIGSYPTESEAWNLIGEEAWFARATEVMAPRTGLVFAVDTNPERSQSCIMAIGKDEPGEIICEITNDNGILDYRPGTNWVVPRLLELCKRHRPNGVVLDLAGNAADYKAKLENAKIKVISPTSREYAQSCGKMYTSIVPGRNNRPNAWHRDQEDLNNAVRGAEKRNLAGLWALTRQNASTDISPLVCMTLGIWGHEKLILEKRSGLDVAWG